MRAGQSRAGGRERREAPWRPQGRWWHPVQGPHSPRELPRRGRLCEVHSHVPGECPRWTGGAANGEAKRARGDGAQPIARRSGRAGMGASAQQRGRWARGGGLSPGAWAEVRVGPEVGAASRPSPRPRSSRSARPRAVLRSARPRAIQPLLAPPKQRRRPQSARVWLLFLRTRTRRSGRGGGPLLRLP